MKTKTIVKLALFMLITSNAKAQIPVTDVASIAQSATSHALEYANMAAQYAKQIQEYTAQIEQLNLQKIAAEVFDTGQFDSTMENLDEYQSAFNLDESKSKLGKLSGFSDLLAQGQDFDAKRFLKALGQATDRKLELSNAQSELATRRMDSIGDDRANLARLQDANANAEGEMQAAQIGNHIDSEMLGQLIKMRQEQAAESQLKAEQDALNASVEAAELAAASEHRADNKRRSEEYQNAPRSKIVEQYK